MCCDNTMLYFFSLTLPCDLSIDRLQKCSRSSSSGLIDPAGFGRRGERAVNPNLLMTLEGLLSGKKSAITKKWLKAVIETYPSDTQIFLKKEGSQFANPVGHSIKEEIERLFEAFVKDDKDGMESALESLLKVRAVQDFRPSEAVAFLFGFRKAIKEELEGELSGEEMSGEFQKMERDLDHMILAAFDVYSRCREKLYNIRVDEVKRQVGRLLQRANLICEIPDSAPNLDNDKSG